MYANIWKNTTLVSYWRANISAGRGIKTVELFHDNDIPLIIPRQNIIALLCVISGTSANTPNFTLQNWQGTSTETKHKNQLRTWFHILCMNIEWGRLDYSWNPSKPVCWVLGIVGGLCCFFSIMQQCESKFYFPWVDCHFKWAHRSC